MITSFHGKYSFLSNFHPAGVSYLGIYYPTVEHAYQAMKSTNQQERIRLSLIEKPGAVKRAGRKLEIQQNWEQLKNNIMFELVTLKFIIPSLTHQLLETGDQLLIEGNYWGDKYWGMVQENGKWVGQNQLGKTLMQVRQKLLTF